MVVSILTGTSTKFGPVMKGWIYGGDRRPSWRHMFAWSFQFMDNSTSFLDFVDRQLIEAICAPEVSQMLCEVLGTSNPDGLEGSYAAFGPGCVILVYYAVGHALGMTGEDPFEYKSQGLARNKSRHELAWEAMKACILMTVGEVFRFEQSHHIRDLSLRIPALQILPGPMIKVSELLHPCIFHNQSNESQGSRGIAWDNTTLDNTPSTAPILKLPSATPQTPEMNTESLQTPPIIDPDPYASRFPRLYIYKTENGYKVSAGRMSIHKAAHTFKQGMAHGVKGTIAVGSGEERGMTEAAAEPQAAEASGKE